MADLNLKGVDRLAQHYQLSPISPYVVLSDDNRGSASQDKHMQELSCKICGR